MMLLCFSTGFILCFSSLSATSTNKIFRNLRRDKNEATYDSRSKTILDETETTVESNATQMPEKNLNTEQGNKSSQTDTKIDGTAKMIDLSHLSPEFYNCTHVSLEPDTYEKLSNGSVYVPEYHMSFDKSNYIIKDDFLFLCPVFYTEYENSEKFSFVIATVSIVCVGISTVCIILHIMMFAMVKRLRNLPGWTLLSLCVALLSAYVCTYIQYEISDLKDCTVIGMFILYFFLSSFFWMNTMAYDVWRSIRMATAKFRLTADRPIKVRFARYSAYSWGIPLIIILISIIVHHTTSNIKYQLIFNINTCWFAYKQALSVYFAIPCFTVVALNMFFFISSFYMVSTAAMSKSASGSQNGSDLWSRLFLSLRLCTVMGLMWIFGFVAAATNQEWLWYLYALCNALQGVFIFFSFTVSERSIKVCKKALKGRKSSAMRTQSSSQSHRSTTVV